MRLTGTRLRQIIKEELSRVSEALRPPRAGFGERQRTGGNLDFLINLVGAFPGQLTGGDLRHALKKFRGIDPSDRANRGYYSSTFAQMDRLPMYVSFNNGKAVLNPAGEERLYMMYAPQSIPSEEEMQDEMMQFLEGRPGFSSDDY